MKKAKTQKGIYRPAIEDSENEIRKRISSILSEFKYLNKKGLEKMVFEAGIPIVTKNLRAVNIQPSQQ